MSSQTATTRPEPLRDQAQAIIREAIVSGEIDPRSIYSAAALAKELGISLSPVREAIVNGGILEPVRNRGFRLVSRSEAEMDRARRAAQEGRVRDFLIHERRVPEPFLVHGVGRRLAQLVLGLRDREHLGTLPELPPEALVAMVDELARVLDAANAGDAESIRHEMQRHLDHVRQDLATQVGPAQRPRLEPVDESAPSCSRR